MQHPYWKASWRFEGRHIVHEAITSWAPAVEDDLSHLNSKHLYLHYIYHNRLWVPRHILIAQLGGQRWLTISNIHKPSPSKCLQRIQRGQLVKNYTQPPTSEFSNMNWRNNLSHLNLEDLHLHNIYITTKCGCHVKCCSRNWVVKGG